MIQANELRIGNWVNTPKGVGAVMQISLKTTLNTKTHFVALKMEWRNNHYKSTLSAITPIPLTPSILENAGFVNNRYGFYEMWIGDGSLCTDTVGDSITSFLTKGVDDAYQEIGLAPVKYLHQLQNLYYCLTRKELEITM